MHAARGHITCHATMCRYARRVHGGGIVGLGGGRGGREEGDGVGVTDD